MSNWKTSCAGLIAAVAQIAARQWPQYADMCQAVSALALAILGIVARDNHGQSVVVLPRSGGGERVELPVVPATKEA